MARRFPWLTSKDFGRRRRVQERGENDWATRRHADTRRRLGKRPLKRDDPDDFTPVSQHESAGIVLVFLLFGAVVLIGGVYVALALVFGGGD